MDERQLSEIRVRFLQLLYRSEEGIRITQVLLLHEPQHRSRNEEINLARVSSGRPLQNHLRVFGHVLAHEEEGA